MAGDAKRVEVGFEGGQVLSLRLTDEQLSELRAALDSGGGWRDLETDEGRISLDSGKVVFVRSAGGPHTIGFSGK
jgi:hypothetical protein